MCVKGENEGKKQEIETNLHKETSNCIFELLGISPQMQMGINEHTEITSDFVTNIFFRVMIIATHLLKQKLKFEQFKTIQVKSWEFLYKWMR